MDVIDLGGFTDEEARELRRMADGLGRSIEETAGEILGLIARRNNEIRRRAVVATVADLALMRARKRPWKVTNS